MNDGKLHAEEGDDYMNFSKGMEEMGGMDGYRASNTGTNISMQAYNKLYNINEPSSDYNPCVGDCVEFGGDYNGCVAECSKNL